MIGDLLNLGQVYNEKIEDEKYYENLIMEDKDFTGRSVLNIISMRQF